MGAHDGRTQSGDQDDGQAVGDALGRVEHYPLTGKWFQSDVWIDGRVQGYLETSITVLRAERAAERKYRGRWNHLGVRSDRGSAVDMAFRLVGSEKQLQHYMAWQEQIAMDLWENDRVWEQVQQLAAELLERKTMSGRAVRELLLAPTVTQGVTRRVAGGSGHCL